MSLGMNFARRRMMAAKKKSKYTWAVYGVTRSEKEIGTGNYQPSRMVKIYYSSSYTVAGDKFELVNPSYGYYVTMGVGTYFVDQPDATDSTVTSGTHLYKVTGYTAIGAATYNYEYKAYEIGVVKGDAELYRVESDTLDYPVDGERNGLWYVLVEGEALVDPILNNNSWETISRVSSAGQAKNIWAIGDRKAVELNGTVGALTLSGTYYAFIIGIDHNAALEGENRIHFQFGKSALSGGSDICFVDSQYDKSGSSAAFRMNTSRVNSGGWNNSYMRKTICPAFKNILPEDLRRVLKSVTKYTNNTGNSTAASAVTATTDEIFLLAEYEARGTITYSNTNESSKQEQYAYYAAGNSVIKHRHDAPGTTAYWTLRSAIASGSIQFVIVYLAGEFGANSANISAGFSPAFCV